MATFSSFKGAKKAIEEALEYIAEIPGASVEVNLYPDNREEVRGEKRYHDFCVEIRGVTFPFPEPEEDDEDTDEDGSEEDN